MHINLVRIAAVAGFFLATPAWSQAVTPAEGEKFFARYVALGEAFDVAVTELYLDDSRIRSLRRYPPGQEKTLEMTGAQWKQLIRSTMPLAKAKGDRGEFGNLRFEAAGNLLRIRADRYSVLKCYRDNGYYMLVGRQPDGRLQVVEEYMETQPQSACETNR
jgi:hypothetical protein